MSSTGIAGLGLLALLVMLALPKRASAYADQVSFDVDLGYSQLIASDRGSAAGVVGAVGGSLGLDDTWTLRSRAAFGYQFEDPSLYSCLFSAEVLYLLDVLQLVPYFGAGLDAMLWLADNAQDFEPGAHLVLGLDYLWSRSLASGIDVRGFIFPSDLSTTPAYLTATVRLSWLFDL